MDTVATDTLHWHDKDGKSFLSQIITRNESWIQHSEPEFQRWLTGWRHKMSPKKKKYKRAPWAERAATRLCGMGKALFFWTSCLRGQQWTMITIFKTLKRLNVRLCRVVPQEERRKGYSSRTAPHLKRAHRVAITAFVRPVLPHPRSLDLALSDVYMLGPLNDSVRGRMTRQCKMACASDSRWENFTGQEHMPSFKHGRTLLTNMDAIPKNNYAFSNAVTKYCYIFMYTACT